jgi:hypothetical protein
MTGRICFIHAGTGKTGSSAIQYALTKLHDELLDRGYDYPDISENFYKALAHKPTTGNAGIVAAKVRDGRLDEAVELLRPLAGDPHHLILSCEGFSNYRPELLKGFGESLRSLGYEPRCLVFFRPQADRIVSSYLQQVKTMKVPNDSTLDEYAAQLVSREKISNRYNWLVRAENLERAFGDLTVKWYPAVTRSGPLGVMQATFDWLGVRSLLDAAAMDVQTINPTPGREALQVLRQVNASGRGGKRFADLLLLEAHRKKMLGSKVALSPELAQRIHDEYSASNLQLITRYCRDVSPAELVLRVAPAEDVDENLVSRLEQMANEIAPAAAERKVEGRRRAGRRRRSRNASAARVA